MRGDNDGEGSDVYFTKTERVARVDLLPWAAAHFSHFLSLTLSFSEVSE